MAINKRTVAAIAGPFAVVVALFASKFEGEAHKVYVDPVGHYAVCVGHDTYAPDGSRLKLGQTYTDEECSVMLGKDVKTAGDALNKLVRVPLSDGERLAYTDFIFNLGAGAFADSTLRRKLNSGDHPGACAELLKWNKGKVKGRYEVLPGLDKRRKEEYAECVKR
ncbi:lysozyme [Burkholderia cenocepacia]|uniref:lysozyme n=1 Tax=Burkholderia cenocepacia TaxID=95486 RepID=UPI0038CBF573